MNKRTINIAYFFILFLVTLSTSVVGQTVKAEVDKDQIFIGEQIKLKLSLEDGILGTHWFKVPDSLNHLEVVDRSKIDTVTKGAFTNYYQTITLTSFDSGRWEFPSLSIAGVAQTTTPIVINVSPVDVTNLKDYHDIKDIEEVAGERNWLIISIIAAVTIISIIVTWWLINKKKKAFTRGAAINSNLSPLDWALAELNSLRQSNINSHAEAKKFYSDLTNISRVFFQRQFNNENKQQTSDEWMISLQSLSIDNETKTAFFQFLRLSDTVKFAKFLPHQKDHETSVESIKNMVQKASLLHSNLYSKYQPK